MITIPTLNELYTSILTDLETEYGINISPVGKVWLRAMAAVQAAKLKMFYLAIGNLQKNIFVDTADPESLGGTLERFGRVKLNRNPFSATQGQYTIEVTGSIGAVIPASSTFKSDDTSLNPGKLFVLDVAYTLIATTDTITVRALDGGDGSQLSIGDTMTATAPIALVNSQAEVTVEVVIPLAAEDIETYRQKAIDAYRAEPQGGAATDYRLWSFDAQGVQQTYPYAKSGAANEINLYIEATVADSTDGKGTPSAQLLLDVEDVVELDPDTTKPINERGRRPLGVFQVHYLPITVRSIDIVISSWTGITPAIETLIFEAFEEEINLIRPYIAGADIYEDKNDILDRNMLISWILNARPGSVFGDITMYVDGIEESTHTFDAGDIPYLESVTYV